MAQRYDFAKFKTDIDLVRYAAHMGFEINQSKSTPTSKAMYNHADKVIISRKGGKWVYFSAVNDDDNGTIIQFVQNRTHQTLGQIGQELNQWIGGGAELPQPTHYTKTIADKIYDPLRIGNIYERCRSSLSHAYLEGRGLNRDLLSSLRFKNRIFKDRYNNAVFPHFNENGVCALELKNADKGIFVTGSEKTLWRSNAFKGDHTLILSEAVIDALSYHALYAPENAMYGATGGGMSSGSGWTWLKPLYRALQA